MDRKRHTMQMINRLRKWLYQIKHFSKQNILSNINRHALQWKNVNLKNVDNNSLKSHEKH